MVLVDFTTRAPGAHSATSSLEVCPDFANAAGDRGHAGEAEVGRVVDMRVGGVHQDLAVALVFHATAQGMKDAARILESLSYAGIALLGVWLVWRKGSGFVAAGRLQHATPSDSMFPARHPLADHAHHRDGHARAEHGHAHVQDHPAVAGFAQVEHVHGPGCGHFHAPDPRILGDRFSWTSALMTVVAAGLRPCSGAILVLVFALAQGIFRAGVYATLAMSLGTAMTTSGLASLTALAGGVAVRIFGESTARGNLVVRGIETCAGVFILLLGLGLFFGVNAGAGA